MTRFILDRRFPRIILFVLTCGALFLAASLPAAMAWPADGLDGGLPLPEEGAVAAPVVAAPDASAAALGADCAEWKYVTSISHHSTYEAGMEWGNSVDIDGDTMIVGANNASSGGEPAAGAALVLYRDEGGADNWGQVKRLQVITPTNSDMFGHSAAIDGDTIVVGTPLRGTGGKAYVFYRNEGGADNWGQVAKLMTTDAASGAIFGLSVAINGNTVVVGSPYRGTGGRAYVFYRNQGGADNWGEVATLTRSDPAGGDQFAWSARAWTATTATTRVRRTCSTRTMTP